MTKPTHRPLTVSEIARVSELTKTRHAARCGCACWVKCLTYIVLRDAASLELYPLDSRRLAPPDRPERYIAPGMRGLAEAYEQAYWRQQS